MSDWVRSMQDTDEMRSKAALIAAKKRSQVEGSEYTSAELEAMERQRKADFLERENRRAAA